MKMSRGLLIFIISVEKQPFPPKKKVYMTNLLL